MVGLADIPAAAGAGLSKSCRTRACSSTPTRLAPDQWAAQRIISANPHHITSQALHWSQFLAEECGVDEGCLFSQSRSERRASPPRVPFYQLPCLRLVAQMAQCPDPQAAWWAPWGCSGGCPARNMLLHELGTDPEDNWGFKQPTGCCGNPLGPPRGPPPLGNAHQF